MIKLGFINLNEVYEVIRNLNYTNFSAGPEENTSPNAPKFFKDGDVWKFGKIVKGLDTLEIYIKICFKEHNEKRYVAYVSFHEPDFEIIYPLKHLTQ